MALIQCPECGKDISDKASVCIHCGYPIGGVSKSPATDEELDALLRSIREDLDKPAGASSEPQTASKEIESSSENPSADPGSSTAEDPQGSPAENDPARAESSGRGKSQAKKEPMGALHSLAIQLIVVAVVIVAIVGGVTLYNSMQLDWTEEAAMSIIEDYRDHLKDPDSLILRSDIVAVDIYTSDKEIHKCYFFDASATNSYGGSVRSTVCYLDGDYMCDADELEDELADRLEDGDTEGALEVTYIALSIAGWAAYGTDYPDYNDEITAVYTVSPKRIAKKLGVECTVD